MAKAKAINLPVSFHNVENQLDILSPDAARHKSVSQFCRGSVPQLLLPLEENRVENVLVEPHGTDFYLN